MDDTERRLAKVEDNIEELFREQRAFAVTQGKMEQTLDHLNLTLRKLEDALTGIQARPGGLWDKVVNAIITALIAGGVAALIGVFVK